VDGGWEAGVGRVEKKTGCVSVCLWCVVCVEWHVLKAA